MPTLVAEDLTQDDLKSRSSSRFSVGFGLTSQDGTHYKLSGDPDKPLVILIHGLGGFSYIFEPLEKELVTKYRVLRYDLIGRGYSRAGRQYNLDDHLSQLSTLLQELKLSKTKCRLIAHSMGGVIASAYAASHPEVCGVCLLSPAGAMDDPVRPFTCLQSCVRSIACCCIPFLSSVVFSGPPPIHEDFATPTNNDGEAGGLSQETIKLGEELSLWSSTLAQASTRTNSARALAASIARMPFTHLLSQVIFDYISDADALKNRQLPFFVLIGQNDMTCRNIRIPEYTSVFGDTVTSATCPGRHCFFVQNSQVAHPMIMEFLDGVSL